MLLQLVDTVRRVQVYRFHWYSQVSDLDILWTLPYQKEAVRACTRQSIDLPRQRCFGDM